MPQPKIIYQDVSPYAKDEAVYSMDKKETYSDLSVLNQDVIEVPHHITLEKNRWVLDGTGSLFPENPEEYQWGVVSSTISGEDGSFADEDIPILVIQFESLQSSVALAFDFDLHTEEYLSQMEISYYNGDEIVAEHVYEPNSKSYCCVGEVKLYDKIEIRMLKTSVPYRRARIFMMYYGVIREFGVDELEKVSVLEEINPINEELSINTMQFAVRNTSEIPFLFQKMQPLQIYYGSILFGTFYIEDSTRRNLNFYDIECIDQIGMLDKSTFYGGIYKEKNVDELIGEIFTSTNIGYTLREDLKGLTVSGYIPICSKRTALLYVIFAIGAIADTSRSSYVNIYMLSDETVKEFGEDETYISGSVNIESKITKVELTSYEYILGTETEELYRGVLPKGENLIKFETAHAEYECTGGTLTASYDNYVIVTSDGLTQTVLTGKVYREIQTIYAKDNENITVADAVNVKSVSGCTLVNSNNAIEILERIFEYYMKTEMVNTKVIIGDVRTGQKATFLTNFDELKPSIILQSNLKFGSRLVSEVRAIADNLNN